MNILYKLLYELIKNIIILIIILILLFAAIVIISMSDITTSSEKNYTEQIFQDINPIYMNNVRSIKYIDYNGEYYGRANQYGDIELNLTGRLYHDKIILCHELIHTIFYTNNVTLDEALAVHLSEQLVCFN